MFISSPDSAVASEMEGGWGMAGLLRKAGTGAGLGWSREATKRLTEEMWLQVMWARGTRELAPEPLAAPTSTPTGEERLQGMLG